MGFPIWTLLHGAWDERTLGHVPLVSSVLTDPLARTLASSSSTSTESSKLSSILIKGTSIHLLSNSSLQPIYNIVRSLICNKQ